MSSIQQAIAVAAICLLSVGTVIMATDREERSTPDQAAKRPNEVLDVDAAIEGLANRNAKPKIINVGERRLPLFPKDYNWEEQKRIVNLHFKLYMNEDPKVWEHWLKHMDDKRYALTFCDAGSRDFARNYTVGELCEQAA